ncbi:MAG: hypothetical protein IIB82_02385 [Bacteroidetes bacterium]|nr:hypothetical protein [Bacteroidota bacterium]
MSRTKIIILSVAVAFFIIAVHQTITLGFEFSYWLFMIPISLILLNRLIDQRESNHKKKHKTTPEKKRSKKVKQQMNRRTKRYMERMK